MNRPIASFRDIAVVPAIAMPAGVLLAFVGVLPPGRILEFCALVIAATLLSATVRPISSAHERDAAPVGVLVNFTSLLMFGPHVTLLIGASFVAAGALASPLRSSPAGRVVRNMATVGVAIELAGLALTVLTKGTTHPSVASQVVPTVAAVIVYAFVAAAGLEIMPSVRRRETVSTSWVKDVARQLPRYVTAAGVALLAAHLLQSRTWEVVLASVVPLYFACCVYGDYLERVEYDRRRREVIDSVEEGMAVVDRAGHVALWSEAAERLLGCARDRVLGHPVASVLPVVGKGELARAIDEAVSTGTPRTVPHVVLASVGQGRALQVKVLPTRDGATLLWRDVSECRRTEQALRRGEERLALAAEGASDGLWSWDLQTQEFYCSGRWNAIVGRPVVASTIPADEWLARVHGDDRAALREAIEAYLAGQAEHFQYEHRIRHENGEYRWVLCRGVASRNGSGRATRIAGSLTDTTERAVARERLRGAGALDSLTGLYNRALFVDGVGRRLEECRQRRVGCRFAVLYLDLDRFKVVNDSLGHLVGDELLVAVSRRLESCVRPTDLLARLGGDEFAILLNGLTEEQANAIAFRIQDALSTPFSIGGREVYTSASIGIAFGSAQYNNPGEIMRDADTAMYHAKSRGKARHELFDEDMHARVRDRLGLENDLRHAVGNNDFEVHYQPIVRLSSGMCVGFESLVRWTRNGKPVSPATFIPMAEELGLIEPLGTWVLQQACRTFAHWQRRFPGAGLDCITVNVSSRQLMQHNFLRIVEQAVQQAGLRPCDLRIEITETALMDNAAVAAEVLRQLRNFGVKIYLDDFGTGYSSLSHLHKLPVDALKIDRSFVKSLLLSDRPAIVESVLALARTLNTSVVAEGIETEPQARELERLGCTHAQGYLFARPLSTTAVEELLVAHLPLGPKRAHAEAMASAWNDPAGTLASGQYEWSGAVPVRQVLPS